MLQSVLVRITKPDGIVTTKSRSHLAITTKLSLLHNPPSEMILLVLPLHQLSISNVGHFSIVFKFIQHIFEICESSLMI